MRLNRSEPMIAWATLILGLALFVGETIHGLRYGGSIPSLLIDYIAASLGVYAGMRSLRSPNGAPGLLFGAWSYALCDVYRALWWRTEHYFGDALPEPLAEPFIVYVIVVALGAATLFFFGATFLLAHPKTGRSP